MRLPVKDGKMMSPGNRPNPVAIDRGVKLSGYGPDRLLMECNMADSDILDNVLDR
jgi:hypothetical protein